MPNWSGIDAGSGRVLPILQGESSNFLGGIAQMQPTEGGIERMISMRLMVRLSPTGLIILLWERNSYCFKNHEMELPLLEVLLGMPKG